jgi:hypothetical protein
MTTDIVRTSGMTKTDEEAARIAEATVLVDENAVTKAELKEALPANLRTKITDSLVQKLNSISNDPMAADVIRDNFIGFQNVMKDGRWKIEDYMNACAYVSYKMMGFSNQQAWGLTFPDRLARMHAEGRVEKQISSFVSAYNKTKLVTLIFEQALIPTHILNQDVYQQAINHQFYLMTNANSEKVQSDAAKCLIDALKPPETAKIEMDVKIEDNSGIGELKNAIVGLAQDQVKRINAGMPTKEIAHQELFEKDGSPVE